MSKNRLRNKIEEIQNTSIGESQTNKIADLIEQEKKAEVMNFIYWMDANVEIYGKYDEQYEEFKEATK
jgi:hypothetical protein